MAEETSAVETLLILKYGSLIAALEAWLINEHCNQHRNTLVKWSKAETKVIRKFLKDEMDGKHEIKFQKADGSTMTVQSQPS